MLLNGSVFSYNEVHECLKQFKQYLASKSNFELYFAKVDVKCCFESIDHDKLMEIIRANVLTKVYIYNKQLLGLMIFVIFLLFKIFYWFFLDTICSKSI